MTPRRLVRSMSAGLAAGALGLLSLAATLGGTQAPAGAATCSVSPKLVSSCRPWLGAAVAGYPGVTGFKNRILDHEARLGRRIDVVHDYLAAPEVLTADDIALARRPGTIALVNYRPTWFWAHGNGSNATVNARIDAMAASVKSLGSTRIMLAVFHEPENDISPGGDPACSSLHFGGSSGKVSDYVAMWHNVRRRFDAAGVTNVVWVMNYMGWKAWNCVVPHMWPGNTYVDWVTWDPYPKTAPWTRFVDLFYDYLSAHSDATHNYLAKAWGLSEFGYVGSDQAAAYAMYDQARHDLTTGHYPRLKMYAVWDCKYATTHDDRVGFTATGVKDSTEQKHFNAFANDPLFLVSG